MLFCNFLRISTQLVVQNLTGHKYTISEWVFRRGDMPRFFVRESWGAAYFSDTQSSDLMPPAIYCSTRIRNKDVGQIYINVKEYLLLLKLYLFLII